LAKVTIAIDFNPYFINHNLLFHFTYFIDKARLIYQLVKVNYQNYQNLLFLIILSNYYHWSLKNYQIGSTYLHQLIAEYYLAVTIASVLN